MEGQGHTGNDLEIKGVQMLDPEMGQRSDKCSSVADCMDATNSQVGSYLLVNFVA